MQNNDLPRTFQLPIIYMVSFVYENSLSNKMFHRHHLLALFRAIVKFPLMKASSVQWLRYQGKNQKSVKFLLLLKHESWLVDFGAVTLPQSMTLDLGHKPANSYCNQWINIQLI